MRVVATAGHVDHGKSTLLRRLTGMEPDRWAEERRRGLTIDLGFVWTDLATPDGPTTVAFVDVPGHERFVPNMLAGTGAVGDALLVVAADDGWSAQTADHVAILDLLGVRGVVAVVTKASLVTVARVDEVAADVGRRLAGTALDGTPVVAADGVTGEGIDEVRRVLGARLVDLPPPEEPGPPRMWVDRAFTVAGAGTVVTGTLRGGRVQVEDEVVLAPSGRSVRVRGLQSLGASVTSAAPGRRVAVNLARVDVDAVHRGDALVAGPCTTTTTADVELRVVGDTPVGHRGAWHLHVGSASVPVRVRPVLGPVAPGTTGAARLELDRPLPLVHGDRFVLRDMGAGTTPAGGRVLDPAPAPRRRGTLARVEVAERLEAFAGAADRTDRVAALLRLHGGWLPVHAVDARLGPGPDVTGPVRRVGSTCVLAERHAEWRRAGLDAVRAVPPDRGAAVEDVVAAMGRAGCPDDVGRAVLDELRADGRLHAVGDRLTTDADAAAHTTARADRRDAVMRAMTATPLAPPDLREVARRRGRQRGEDS